jgi:hypothetical protein
MIRLHVIAEGQTEEEFVNSVLSFHLGAFDISTDVRCVETGRRRANPRVGQVGRIYRGGLIDFPRARKDIMLWMKEDQNDDAYFTTMFDLYALPEDFPGFLDARRQPDPYSRVGHLEAAFGNDISHRRFIPYIQLHEFEALILSDPTKFTPRFIEHADKINDLVLMCSQFVSPELINDGAESAPSKRIIRSIPDYAGSKASAGPLIAQRIGLESIRQKCPHFSDWVERLEKLSAH